MDRIIPSDDYPAGWQASVGECIRRILAADLQVSAPLVEAGLGLPLQQAQARHQVSWPISTSVQASPVAQGHSRLGAQLRFAAHTSHIMLAHQRWVIEQFYEDAKDECGLDHYQGRRWDGLHRHVSLSMLAYSFLQLHCQQHATAGGFFLSAPRPSLPAVHRTILLWLFQDLVLWLVATNQI